MLSILVFHTAANLPKPDAKVTVVDNVEKSILLVCVVGERIIKVLHQVCH